MLLEEKKKLKVLLLVLTLFNAILFWFLKSSDFYFYPDSYIFTLNAYSLFEVTQSLTISESAFNSLHKPLFSILIGTFNIVTNISIESLTSTIPKLSWLTILLVIYWNTVRVKTNLKTALVFSTFATVNSLLIWSNFRMSDVFIVALTFIYLHLYTSKETKLIIQKPFLKVLLDATFISSNIINIVTYLQFSKGVSLRKFIEILQVIVVSLLIILPLIIRNDLLPEIVKYINHNILLTLVVLVVLVIGLLIQNKLRANERLIKYILIANLLISVVMWSQNIFGDISLIFLYFCLLFSDLSKKSDINSKIVISMFATSTLLTINNYANPRYLIYQIPFIFFLVVINIDSLKILERKLIQVIVSSLVIIQLAFLFMNNFNELDYEQSNSRQIQEILPSFIKNRNTVFLSSRPYGYYHFLSNKTVPLWSSDDVIERFKDTNRYFVLIEDQHYKSSAQQYPFNTEPDFKITVPKAEVDFRDREYSEPSIKTRVLIWDFESKENLN